MSLQYRAIGWNPQKRNYDLVLAFSVAGYLAVFVGLGAWIHPYVTIETLLIRGFGTASFLLLHIILCIGPLCRLDPRFLPLLYNRRHMGVTMFLLALAHGTFALIQFHGLGNLNPLVSLLTSNLKYNSLPNFPFQQLGLMALLILFMMAATSHDFWLSNLTPPVWKRLHMGVYLAYGLLVGHVTLGVLQSETNWILGWIVGLGLAVVVGLHIAASVRERRIDNLKHVADGEGFVRVCTVTGIPNNRARVISLGGERIAIFRYDGKISALSNVCVHQNGPLGEGKIIDGCVTCPWHGYQYLPETGVSPPPFHEKVATFPTRVIDGNVFVHSRPCEPGTTQQPTLVDKRSETPDQDEFYIGYEPKAPALLANLLKRVVLGLSAGALAVAVVLVLVQHPFEPSAFEFQIYRNFEGVFQESPLPSLLTKRPGAQESSHDVSRYLLVAPGKHGVDPELAGFHNKKVRLQGALIYRDGLTMIELLPASLQLMDAGLGEIKYPNIEDLGTYTLKGEIVDSKCFIGVMNPGDGKVHRDCAVRCISGGIPPGFLVRNQKGEATLLLLQGADGHAINNEILDRVAEPIEISGQVIRLGDTLILRSEPGTFRTISSTRK